MLSKLTDWYSIATAGRDISCIFIFYYNLYENKALKMCQRLKRVQPTVGGATGL